MRQSFVRYAAACFFTLAAMTASRASDGVVRIGVLNDQSGVFADSTGAGSTLSARMAADKTAILLIQLPLGISLTEPVQLKVNTGAAERYPVQTCTNVGCIVNVPLKDPLLATMRTGTLLKITIQDTNKRTINIDVPLLGFALAFDKAK